MSVSRPQYTLQKSERLSEKKLMDELFMRGESIQVPGIKLLWKKETNYQIIKSSNHQIRAAFSVPKRNFKKAVTRNLLKRRMREAYRKNKLFPVGSPGKQDSIYYLIFIYTGRKIIPYSEIESKIVVALQRLKKAAGTDE